jgi:hypothetical protein
LYSELASLVHDRHANFAAYAVSARVELSFHRPYIEVLEEAVAEGVINLKECTDDGVRELLFDQIDPRHSVRSRDDANNKSPNSRHQDLSQSGDDPKHQPQSEASVLEV